LIKISVLLALAQMSFAETSDSHTEDLKENISCSYPFYYDIDAISDEDEHGSKDDLLKGESPTAQHAKIGNAEVTVDVENTDFSSQCQAKWGEMRDKREQKRSNSKKSDHAEDNHLPRAKFSIDWSTDD